MRKQREGEHSRLEEPVSLARKVRQLEHSVAELTDIITRQEMRLQKMERMMMGMKVG